MRSCATRPVLLSEGEGSRRARLKPGAAEEPRLGDGHQGGLAGQGRPRRDSDTGAGAHWEAEALSLHCSSPRGASNERLCGDRGPPGHLRQTAPESPRGVRSCLLTVPLRRMLRVPALPVAHDVARVCGPWRDHASQKDSRAFSTGLKNTLCIQ